MFANSACIWFEEAELCETSTISVIKLWYAVSNLTPDLAKFFKSFCVKEIRKYDNNLIGSLIANKTIIADYNY